MATPPDLPTRSAPRLRRYRRVSRASIPFFPLGFFAVLGWLGVGLFALYPFAHLEVEGTIRAEARDRLDRAGFEWAELGVSGRRVVVSGVPPSPEDGERAVAVVRDLRVQTWAGPMSPVEAAVGSFSAAPPPEPTAATPVAWTDWEFRLEAGVLALAGAVADEGTRDEVVAAATGRIDPPRVSSVVDQLAVVGQPASAPALALALRGVDTLGRCASGVARFAAGTFTLRCEVEAAKVQAVRTAASAPAPPATVGAVDLVELEGVERCEEALNQALTAEPIRFDSRSAVIDVASTAGVDHVVPVVRDCPGRLSIAGPGDDPPDPTLAASRAEAVVAALVARGIPAERLVVGTSPHGPARRIEIHVVRSTEPAPPP